MLGNALVWKEIQSGKTSAPLQIVGLVNSADGPVGTKCLSILQ
jgi:hypothetical protein